MVYVEPTFPRGRKSDTEIDHKPRKKIKRNLDYGASTINEEKLPKRRQRERNLARLEQLEHEKEELEQSVTAAPLHYNTVEEGMLLMGVIQKINRMFLKVSLPGRLYGRVPVTSISETYTERLQKLVEQGDSATTEICCPGLDELYSTGELIYVKVLEKSPELMILSLDPKQLHSEFSYRRLVEGIVLSATIETEEDHGYQMNVGIKNVRAFLPTKNIRKNKMVIGANLVCTIDKITKTSNSATVILKAFKPNAPRKLQIEEANLDVLVPSVVLPFTVGAVLHDGLQGTLFDDTVPAFVNKNMLEKPLSQPENYKLLQQYQARLLYVMPLTKHVYLTLANCDGNTMNVTDPVPSQSIVADAQVINKSSTGVWFQVGKKHRALLPKAMLNSKHNYNYDEHMVMAKYHKNSVHKVRVIRYMAFDRTIIVTDEEKAVNCRYYSVSDLKVGQVYECCVSRVLPEKRGYEVVLDQVKGAVRDQQFTFVKPLAENNTIKLCFIGGLFHAKFTNHPLFLKKSAKLLTSKESIRIGQQYLGIVICERDTFFLVLFCNNIKGILFKHRRSLDQDRDEIGHLVPGKARYFTVAEVADGGEKIVLSIPVDKSANSFGQLRTAVVKGVFATGTDIQFVDTKETGVIAPECYSDFPDHNLIYQKLLREGDQLTVANIAENEYSLRDVGFLKQDTKSAAEVRRGQVLRAYCVSKDKRQVVLRLALCDYTRKVVLSVEDFNAEKARFKIEENQVILVRVMKKFMKPDGVLLFVSPRLDHVCSQSVDNVMDYMQSYLKDVKDVVNRFKTQENSFAQYTIGQEVTCEVENFVEGTDVLVVSVHGEHGMAKGLARKDPKRDDYAIGDQLQGRVVWLDIETQLVHVCVVKKALKHLSSGDDMPAALFDTNEKYDFKALYHNSYVAVGYIKKKSYPLVIVPVRCHYNDFTPLDPVSIGKVVCIRNYDHLIFGMTLENYERFTSMEVIEFESQDEEYDQLADHCEETLPTDMEEYSADRKGDKAEGNGLPDSISGSGSEQGEPSTAINGGPRKLTKKCKRKKTRKIKKVPTKSLSGKKLKEKKTKKKSLAKKLNTIPDLTISQLDGANDLIKTKRKNKFKFAKNAVKQCSAEDEATNHQQSNQDKNKLKRKTKNKQSVSSPPVQDDTRCSTYGSKPSKSKSVEVSLPGAEDFWNTSMHHGAAAQPESDSSDEDSGIEQQPKKRLTAKERFEALKQEEKRIRKIEDELADASANPHTPDQFDRLTLAQPNSSLLWIRYMAFHMESAEVEKARAVARRALKAINFREEGERLNVWIALLNLELRYESADVFNEVLQEAVRCNDPFKVYSRVIQILIDCEKTPQVLEMIETLQKKFRKESEMWLLVASSYYQIGQGSKVKPLLCKALKSLENKEHIPLIVKFAFLHNRNGYRDEAHILFEQILTSYPKRTDIWSQYVDMLVKDGLIDVARETLDRAIAQRLPMRNMKTLYTKYVNFEEKHGTQEAVRKIKQMAADYVKSQLKASGVSEERVES